MIAPLRPWRLRGWLPRCVLFFVFGDQPEQVAVGLGAQHLGAAAIAVQKARGEDTRAVFALAGFGFKFVERGQGNAVSAVEVAENVKDLGFGLVLVGTRALGFAGCLGRGCGAGLVRIAL